MTEGDGPIIMDSHRRRCHPLRRWLLIRKGKLGLSRRIDPESTETAEVEAFVRFPRLSTLGERRVCPVAIVPGTMYFDGTLEAVL